MRAARRAPFRLAIRPASLARVGQHVLTLRMKPRSGRARVRSIRLRTFGRRTLFRAHQYRTPTGTRLGLRIDARDSVNGVTFTVPRRMLPKPAARRAAGRLRVVAEATGFPSRRLVFGRARYGPLVTTSPAPRVTLGRRTVTVTELQPTPGSSRSRSARAARRGPGRGWRPARSVRLRATVAGVTPQRLSFKLRGRGR